MDDTDQSILLQWLLTDVDCVPRVEHIFHHISGDVPNCSAKWLETVKMFLRSYSPVIFKSLAAKAKKFALLWLFL